MTTADGAAQNETSAASARQRWLLLAPQLLIVAGAGLGLLALVYDYFAIPDALADFGGNRSFGQKQLIAILAGAVAMAAGVGLSLLVEPARRAETLRFWSVAAQVGLLVAAVRLYEVENLAFYELVFPLIAFGFVIHHHLGPGLRKPFFFVLALACYLGVFASASLIAGLWLIGLALSLIVIASLPISAWIRAGLLAAAGVGFALMRLGWIDTGWSGVILPVLSSMFIFRAAIYLYDSASGKGPASWWQRLSYFFLPPNVVFPFFPVVDYATFGRTYYNEEAVRIYQRGANWIVRGLVHLVVYRAVYLYGVISPESVDGAGDFLRYIVANFGLYLRISGLFHLIVGTILLFGYNLPETHTRFYFSSSFIDFWRRINIYWKDFMQKMVFTPAFMRLRRLGAPQLAGIVASMFAVFFATWALHAYQWFWLRGTMLFTLPDMLFWGGLAVLLAVQTIHESRPAPAARPARIGILGPRAFLVLRTACTFLTICLMWSLWTSETLSAWGELWIRSGLTPAFDGASGGGFADWALTLATLGAVGFATAVAAGFTFGLARPAAGGLGARKRAAPFRPLWAATMGACAILALILVQTPAVLGVLGRQVQTFAEDVRTPRLNRRDQALMERGYYENLTSVNNFNSRLWELYMARPNGRSRVDDAPFIRQRTDALEYDFLPGASAMFNGVTYEINRWGMRDVDVAMEKPEGVFRIGLDGSSQVSGWGVEIESRFDKILAASLNGAAAEGGARYETLNFAVDGYVLTERLTLFDEKAWDFDLDAVLIFSQVTRDLNVEHLAKMYVRGTPPDYPFIHDAIERAGLTPDMTEAEVVGRLLDLRYDIARGAYAHFAEQARARGVTAVWVYLPLVEPQWNDSDVATLNRLAREAGLATLDLSGVFEGHDFSRLQIAAWDNHPNAAGHQLMAEALERGLRELETHGLIEFGLTD